MDYVVLFKASVLLLSSWLYKEPFTTMLVITKVLTILTVHSDADLVGKIGLKHVHQLVVCSLVSQSQISLISVHIY